MEFSNLKQNKFADLIAAAPAAPAATTSTTQTEAQLGQSVLNFNSNLSLWTVITNVLTFLLSIGLLLSILFLTVGGIQFITSTGNKEKQKTATETIKYAVIGIVLILGFGIILTIFTGLFGTPSGTSSGSPSATP